MESYVRDGGCVPGQFMECSNLSGYLVNAPGPSCMFHGPCMPTKAILVDTLESSTGWTDSDRCGAGLGGGAAMPWLVPAESAGASARGKGAGVLMVVPSFGRG